LFSISPRLAPCLEMKCGFGGSDLPVLPQSHVYATQSLRAKQSNQAEQTISLCALSRCFSSVRAGRRANSAWLGLTYKGNELARLVNKMSKKVDSAWLVSSLSQLSPSLGRDNQTGPQLTLSSTSVPVWHTDSQSLTGHNSKRWDCTASISVGSDPFDNVERFNKPDICEPTNMSTVWEVLNTTRQSIVC
jgi:hypothetical protein